MKTAEQGRAASGVAAKTPEAGKRAWPLAVRLTALYAACSLVILSAAVLVLYVMLADALRYDHDQFLADKVRVLRQLLRDRPNDMAALREEVEETWAPRQYAQVRVRILGPNGRTLVESPLMTDRLPPAMFPAPVGPTDAAGAGVDVVSTKDAPFRAMAAKAMIGHDGTEAATMQVALDVLPDQRLLGAYRERLLFVLVIAMTLCVLAGHQVARRGLRPLYDIADTARRIGPSRLHERVRTAGVPAEVSALAETLNAMLERLAEAFGRLSRFSADIAHELRTPVNNLRVEIEVALGRDRSVGEYRETLGSSLEECARLTRIIDCLLFIARAEDPRTQVRREDVGVAAELQLVCDFYEAPATEAGIVLNTCCADNVRAELDRTLFHRAVANLISNALDHTPTGGAITVSAERVGNELRVEVADTGQGIGPEDLQRVFDRFFRVDGSRSASPATSKTGSAAHAGLGLAIVKSISLLHGGRVDMKSELGKGTRVTLYFPTVDASTERTPKVATAPVRAPAYT